MAKKNQEVELGDMAKDTVTGYTGVVVSFSRHLTGCDRWTLQAPAKPDGKIPDAYNFDVTTVEVIKKRVAIPTMQYVVTEGEPPAVQPTDRPGGPATRATENR